MGYDLTGHGWRLGWRGIMRCDGQSEWLFGLQQTRCCRSDYSFVDECALFSRRMKLSAAVKFCQRFATSHRAGVPIVRLLQSETKQGPPAQQKIMAEMAAGAQDGKQLHEMMEEQKPFFPVLLTAMTAVGEETGKLDRALTILAGHMRHQLDTRKKFIRSISWPVFQFFAAVGVFSLLIYIMGIMGDRMSDILGLGLRGGSGVLTLWGFVALLVGAIALVVWGFMRNVGGIQNLAPLLYMIPWLGPSIQTITISRFCWTMALSLEAGLDPIRAIHLSLDSTGSDYYRSGSDDARDAIRDGATLAGSLQATAVFPEDFISRVDIAEQSGTDAESMEILAREYDERAEAAVRFLSNAATMFVRVTISCILIFFIFKIAMTYLGAINDAAQPINPRSRF